MKYVSRVYSIWSVKFEVSFYKKKFLNVDFKVLEFKVQSYEVCNAKSLTRSDSKRWICRRFKYTSGDACATCTCLKINYNVAMRSILNLI